MRILNRLVAVFTQNWPSVGDPGSDPSFCATAFRISSRFMSTGTPNSLGIQSPPQLRYALPENGNANTTVNWLTELYVISPSIVVPAESTVVTFGNPPRLCVTTHVVLATSWSCT